jgi:oxygen-independent coproporphyrinogen-3 oxidase
MTRATDLTIAISEAKDFLHNNLRRPQVNRILHGFPSPRFWRNGEVDVNQELDRRDRLSTGDAAPFSLYVGVPYCIRTNPDRCGYCLFPVEIFEGSRQFDFYLDSLEKEGVFYKGRFTEVLPESVYIGGGTPNLMKPAQYLRLMEIVFGVFPRLSEHPPITLEGIPQLFTFEKIQTMKAAGINRISMGVQQLNETLNQLSGRKQTARHVFQALEWARSEGIAANVDLIFGWPQQTVATMMRDLEQIVATGVDHITHYELNVGGATDFALNRRDELPSPEETREMYHASREYLTAHGYKQLTTYDFQRIEDVSGYVYEECRRDFSRSDLLGWGFAGVTDFGGTSDEPGGVYVNHRKAQKYTECVACGTPPVERGFRRTAKDLRLQGLFKTLQSFHIDRVSYSSRFGCDVFEEFFPEWTALEEFGLCEKHADGIDLTPAGTYYVPLIQQLLSQPRLRQLIQAEQEIRVAELDNARTIGA